MIPKFDPKRMALRRLKRRRRNPRLISFVRLSTKLQSYRVTKRPKLPPKFKKRLNENFD